MGKQKKNSSGVSREDTISSLSDTMLLEILSFLDMKHAVQTSILSKRWRDLWTSLRSLTFDTQLFYSPENEYWYDEFLEFVDEVLLLRDNSDIDKFHLISSYPDCEIESRLNTWIISVIRRKVQQLHIELCGDGIRLPNSLFTCNTLTRLILWICNNERWSINLPADSMCLPNLWDLQLHSVSFHDENLTNKFFLSCPNLEILILGDVEFLHMNVNISCLELRYLTIHNHGLQGYGYCRWLDSKLELYAPNLEWFRCQDFMSKDYTLNNFASLCEADIDMKVEEEEKNPGIYLQLPAKKKQIYGQQMMEFLRRFHNVKVLKLSAWLELRMEKKENEEEAAGVDEISDLPDAILHHIFSFLNMEEAVRSSVYSKRWRDLWISLPTLNFEYRDDDINSENHKMMMGLVDKVLILRDCSHIQRFSLICSKLPSTSSPVVNTWIVSALRRSNLQELVLETFFEKKLPLPTCLFNSKSLTLLKLVSNDPRNYLTLPLPASACLPSLKTLFLESIRFVDEYRVNKFFSNCPVLESLTITDCSFLHINIKISSLSLEHLAIEDYFGDNDILIDSSVRLKTPNLISFRCKDYMMGKKYYLEDISSLIKADICMIREDKQHIPPPDDQTKKHVLTFLEACCNVEYLTLSATILEAISSYPCFLESNPSAIICPCFLHSNPTGFCNLRCLEIDASFSGDCISAITSLLKISPTIETLFVNRPQIKLDSEADHDMVTYQDEVLFPCLLDKLEHVEIRDAIGCGNELKFFEILLKNAKVLKNLVVYTRSEDLVDRSVRMKKFTKLLKFPRASSNVSILFI